jgi:hypothetical protein
VPKFVFHMDEPRDVDPEKRRLAFRRALDLVATFIAPTETPDQTRKEFERLLNEDLTLGLNALYGLAASWPATSSRTPRRRDASRWTCFEAWKAPWSGIEDG